MKVFALIFLTAVVCGQEDLDNMELSAALESDKALMSYADCLLDKGPCTDHMKKIKELIPKTLESSCAECSAEQKEFGKKAINLVKTSYPKIWSDLQNHYDPEGKYKESLEKFLSS